MRMSITARHCAVPEELRSRAEAVVTKAATMAHRPQRAEVVFDATGGRKAVELHLFMPRGRVKVATAEGEDFRSALDAAVAKLRNQLGKSERHGARRALSD